MDTGGTGEGGKNWEMSIDISMLLCVIKIASGNLLYGTWGSAVCCRLPGRTESDTTEAT